MGDAALRLARYRSDEYRELMSERDRLKERRALLGSEYAAVNLRLEQETKGSPKWRSILREKSEVELRLGAVRKALRKNATAIEDLEQRMRAEAILTFEQFFVYVVKDAVSPEQFKRWADEAGRRFDEQEIIPED